ncbi:NAD(P)-dependent oxidoreductase [Streptomyces smyrnaeus]|uniref:NAD(P)-dependent oxidoreductase n=1 Tax=Streptomyces smyrnaeus TaxID=1387713 RepID=A0ABS3XVA7_9ACTN|nr:NAD(P)-binding domain-containing protein [Streptomyces smyrnaeus]MBO8199246.1 NAD(P)-dependent oxidoreductase [Streptomyces smyrnaeus]
MTIASDTTTRPAAEAGPVTVLGLGAMGSAIARTFLDHGHPTTVWNRTAAKTAPLADAGATAAPTAAEAVAASPLVVVALLDSAAVEEVLASVGTAVSGRTLVNLTSGSPSQARANERWAREHGAAGYLDGKIMGDPPYVGTPDILFPFSGSDTAFAAHETTLRELGTVTYHGEEPGAAAVEFMAQVSPPPTSCSSATCTPCGCSAKKASTWPGSPSGSAPPWPSFRRYWARWPKRSRPVGTGRTSARSTSRRH